MGKNWNTASVFGHDYLTKIQNEQEFGFKRSVSVNCLLSTQSYALFYPIQILKLYSVVQQVPGRKLPSKNIQKNSSPPVHSPWIGSPVHGSLGLESNPILRFAWIVNFGPNICTKQKRKGFHFVLSTAGCRIDHIIDFVSWAFSKIY